MLPPKVATHIAASARPSHGRGGSGVQAAGGETVPRGERPDGGHLSGLRDLRADPAGVGPAVPPEGRGGLGEPFPEAPSLPPGRRRGDLVGALGLNVWTLEYHLAVLEREGLLRAVRKGHPLLYYPREDPPPNDPLHQVHSPILHT